MRRFLPFLIILALVFGASYAAALINRVMGPWSATGIEQDGSLSHFQFGPDLPRPAWVPVYPGATVVQGSRVTTARAPSGFSTVELAVRASLADVKRFYTERLEAEGFEVADLGLMSLDPRTAAMLGIAGALSAKRPATDDAIDVQIRTADGLIASRLLQVHWRKISEYPLSAQPPQAEAPAGKS
jgi:hypothetical protein